jgi:beta-1,4-N-acetylglucosaminyltransferase
MKSEFFNIFVTVGTTEFDELLQAVDNESFLQSIIFYRCKRLSIQIGRGKYYPKFLADASTSSGIEVDIFRFKDTLDDYMQNADLVICHCGAGSILECLNLKKIFIVVVNKTLQGNHQTDLAEALSCKGLCLSTVPDLLVDLLRSESSQCFSSMRSYPDGDYDAFPAIVDSMYDFH